MLLSLGCLVTDFVGVGTAVSWGEQARVWDDQRKRASKVAASCRCGDDAGSRSHTLLRLYVEGIGDRDTTLGILDLVDLAGSERLDRTEAKGVRQQEGVAINLSLHTFGLVVQKLTQKVEKQHIPYRDSRLTRILQVPLAVNPATP